MQPSIGDLKAQLDDHGERLQNIEGNSTVSTGERETVPNSPVQDNTELGTPSLFAQVTRPANSITEKAEQDNGRP